MKKVKKILSRQTISKLSFDELVAPSFSFEDFPETEGFGPGITSFQADKDLNEDLGHKIHLRIQKRNAVDELLNTDFFCPILFC